MNKIMFELRDSDIVCTHVAIDNPMSQNFDFHTHDICELLFLKKGNVSAVSGAKVYKMQKDSIIIGILI